MPSRPLCSGCARPTVVKGGVCRTCQPQARRIAGKPCDGCGTWTTAAKGTCKRCVRGTRKLKVTNVGALRPGKDGEWITGPDLIARWVPTPKRKKAA